MTGKQRNIWYERLAVLRSLDLTGVAWQVNLARAKQAGVSLAELPSHQRCNPRQMKRVLEALVEECSRSVDVAVSYKQLQHKLLMSRNTVHRAVKGLRDAYLVSVDEQGTLAHGQSPNLYAVCWPNLIDVARSQGLQWQLFAEESTFTQPQLRNELPEDNFARGQKGFAATVAPRGSRPTHLSATGQSPPLGEDFERGKTSESGPPPLPQWGPPPPTVGGPPSHFAASENSNARALESSPQRGEENEFEEENFLLLHSSNRMRAELSARLETYGISKRSLRILFQNAGKNGWSDAQISDLLAWCERQVVGDVQAFGPGIIFRHVERFPPGPINVNERDEYIRAKRDRDQRIAAKRKAGEDALRAREREANKSRNDELKRLFKPVLAELSNSDRRALLDRHGVTFDLPFVPELKLLELLKKDATQEAALLEGAGGGDGPPIAGQEIEGELI